jgi:cellulose synthase/poly-beta-1,6-N-acetylglucosamine synthase-like glycosyltransferase
MPDTEVGPDISILIAARNEEKTILACLQAIQALDYPTDRLEVLIGNDQSTDATAAVVADYIVDKPVFRLISTADSPTGLRGKANVLAQLAQQARGEYLFFTDADTQVSPDWLTAMRGHFTGKVGIVTGVTLPDGPRLFHKLQGIDWLYNLTLTHLMSSFGFALTAMGNNMAVARSAYKAVGGYEALPFSVVEDYTLFNAIVGKGYDFRNVLTEAVLARTQPVDTLRQFLNQRKRWMRGATDLPGWIVLALYAQYLAGPLLLLLGWFMPVLAVGVYLLKLFVQTLVISFGLGRLRQTSLMPYALLFEIYQLIIGPLSVVYYLLPNPIEWKGRNYR